jgi:5-methyltetrahydrofolate--homocysteine methyltransferase
MHEGAIQMSVLDDISESIIDGNKNGAVEGVKKALDEGIAAGTILHEALIPAMTKVGELFEEGEYFVPEMLISARAMQAGIDLIKPLLIEGGIEPVGRVAIGTVKGDLHDIGKNLVAMMLEGAGFEINDLGVNVEPDAFVQAVRDGAQVIAMSALLTTTMSSMSTTIDALKSAGLRDNVKVMVGGAPITQTYADEIGADGYSTDASSAARLAKQLVSVI